MLSQLFKGRKKLKAKTPSKKSKGKWKEGESSFYAHTEEEEQSNSESSKPPSEEGGNSKNESTHSKRMNKLEQRLKAFTYRKVLQEAGVVRPYPTEWDLVPYPPKFKVSTLQAFDGKGSPNQHIYYFKFQTENVISNIAIMAHLLLAPSNG